MLLHVILADDNIQRVRIESLPETVDELKTILKNHLTLEGEMVIQFQDPEFNNEFCNLTDISELPREMLKLKIIMSDYTLDTGSLDTSSGSSGETSSRSKHWLDPFTIPSFSYDIELKLRRGNEAYEKDGSLFTPTNDVKTDILDKVGRAMYDFNAYPTPKQVEDVAKALVEKHPCLKEPGSTQGWYCWKFSLSFKMRNLRQKYRIAGCPELTVNRKRSAGQETRKMKTAKRAEINFLPDFPQGRTPNSFEEERIILQDEVKKKKPDCNLIDSLMGRSFALQRQEIVEKEPLVAEIAAEFTRLVAADLPKSFLSGLDRYLPRLLELYKARERCDTKIHSLLESLDSEKRRSAALLGLPYFMKENPSNFIKFCEATDSEEAAAVNGVDVGVLIVTEEREPAALPKNIADVAVILEGRIVLRKLRDVPTGFAVLMGILYSLNIDYPKGLKYTFEVIQKIHTPAAPPATSSHLPGLSCSSSPLSELLVPV
ncbi:hypothetical protein NQZ68_019295 [Dissostichus eleginoides]|nr:hypothetical protein NQZ68_019295 [Dissostichus eleginoides]